MKKNQFIRFYTSSVLLWKILLTSSLILFVSGNYISCNKAPLQSDINNIKSIYLKIEQEYSDVDESLNLPLDKVLSDIFNKIGVRCVKNSDSCDAILYVKVSGKPYKTVFMKPAGMFYESACVKGKARLKIKNFSTKIVDIYGKRHYFSTTYYPHSNTDPGVPLIFASKKAFIRMIYHLWGPEVIFKIWDLSIFPPMDEKFNEISDDALSILPEIFHALENDTTSIRSKAILLLDELTKSEKLKIASDPNRAPRTRSSEILNRNTKVRKEISKNIDRFNNIIKNDFYNDRADLKYLLNILSRLGNDASHSLPLLDEMLKSDNPKLKPVVIKTIEKIKSIE